jgi:hypothetical protein
VHGFQIAVRYFDLIRSDPILESRFQQLKGILGETYLNFCVDANMYQV